MVTSVTYEKRQVGESCVINEERADIVEYDRGAPRAWAEELARLDPANPPGDVPSNRWQRFIDDCGRFLDQGWASRAEALDWAPRDLFGCDRDRPFARLDQMGLLWLLNGRNLIALTAEMAAIETPTGGRQTYRRRFLAVEGVVLAWELSTRMNPVPAQVRPHRECARTENDDGKD
jgi:hypothetical protein